MNLTNSSAPHPLILFIPTSIAMSKTFTSRYHPLTPILSSTSSSLSSTTISQDKAAVLAYLRLKHKDPYKGYVLCAIVRLSILPFRYHY